MVADEEINDMTKHLQLKRALFEAYHQINKNVFGQALPTSGIGTSPEHRTAAAAVAAAPTALEHRTLGHQHQHPTAQTLDLDIRARIVSEQIHQKASHSQRQETSHFAQAETSSHSLTHELSHCATAETYPEPGTAVGPCPTAGRFAGRRVVAWPCSPNPRRRGCSE